MPTDPKTGRPIAGPADDATRKRMLAQRLAEREPVGLYESKRLGGVPTPPPQYENKTIIGKEREKINDARNKRINKAVEDAGG